MLGSHHYLWRHGSARQPNNAYMDYPHKW
ncbi:hypothetical protein OF001_U180003 [Pseudomonas sp. OF001]|nr:hypothetical protein OF001_U180003 [Pseudomonas sp. OF001]